MPKKRRSTILPMSTSKAAEEESPLPAGISDSTSASKPPNIFPLSIKLLHTPRISAAGVPASSGRGSVSPMSTENSPKSLERIFTVSVPLGAASAVMPRETPAASTQPPWWSVWLPPSSVLPGTKISILSMDAPPFCFHYYSAAAAKMEEPFAMLNERLKFLTFGGGRVLA